MRSSNALSLPARHSAPTIRTIGAAIVVAVIWPAGTVRALEPDTGHSAPAEASVAQPHQDHHQPAPPGNADAGHGDPHSAAGPAHDTSAVGDPHHGPDAGQVAASALSPAETPPWYEWYIGIVVAFFVLAVVIGTTTALVRGETPPPPGSGDGPDRHDGHDGHHH